MLRINTTGETREVTVNGDSPAFKNTAYEGQAFSVTARSLSAAEQSRIDKATVKTKGRDVSVDTDFATKERFTKMVTAWEGFGDNEGNPLECNEVNRAAFAKHDANLARMILNAIEEAFDEQRIVKEEAVKN